MKVENVLSRAPISIVQKIEVGRMVGELMKAKGLGLSVDTVRISHPISGLQNNLVNVKAETPNVGLTHEIVGPMHHATRQRLAVKVSGNGFQAESWNYPNSEPVILFDLRKGGGQQRSSRPIVPVSEDVGYILE